tara:strand:+ start:35455 stop:36615 length:1161 start_codon:yes stop_codon:yes gene_type:complete
MKFTDLELGLAKDALINHESSKNFVEIFEKDFARHLNSKYAVACNSGTSGLHAALFAAGVRPGDEVIIPGLTVIMDAYAVLYMNAVPVFADVELDTFLIDHNDIKNKITKKTKAIITVSWEGLMCDMDAVNQIANDNNLIVIDDSARTVDGYYKDVISGKSADMTVFSFESKKHLTTGGEGGMITTDDEMLAKQLRKFVGIGYKHLEADAGATHLALSNVQDPNYLRFDMVAPNYRLNQISAAIGIGQLRRIDEIVDKRKTIGNLFLNATKNLAPWFIPQFTPQGRINAFYTFSARYLLKDKNKTWKDFYNEYRKRGGDGFYGCVMNPYLEPSLLGKSKSYQIYQEGLCPNAELIQRESMCFKTNYRNIDDAKAQIDLLVDLINSW